MVCLLQVFLAQYYISPQNLMALRVKNQQYQFGFLNQLRALIFEITFARDIGMHV